MVKTFEQWLSSSALNGASITYIESLYDDFVANPQNVEPSWRSIFETFENRSANEQSHLQICNQIRSLETTPKTKKTPCDATQNFQLVKLLQFINAHRFRGFLEAKLDPLNQYFWKKTTVPELDYHAHGFNESDLDKTFEINQYVYDTQAITLRNLDQKLKQTYCQNIAFEFMHLQNIEMRNWLQRKQESILNKPLFNNQQKITFLQELISADYFERYLGATFPGAKRFSLEGTDSFIVLIKEIIRHSSTLDTTDVIIGMAHRGRLNALVNIMGKKSSDLFDEFAGKMQDLRSGDVKYHQGFSSDVKIGDRTMHLGLAFNPSHLEIVSPVVMGAVRAKQDLLSDDKKYQILPITVHGDSAVSGQGVVQETLNMAKTRGFNVGGTIRIVINNQVGFTTSNTNDTRSSEFCTSIAKMIDAPIIHINADDPEMVAFAAQMASEFRAKFNQDIFIDLIGYRRNGHNEADEPMATQPQMYQIIKNHPRVTQIYAEKLINEQVLTAEQVDGFINDYRQKLDRGEIVLNEYQKPNINKMLWLDYVDHSWQCPYESGENLDNFYRLAQKVCKYPDEITPHSRVAKIYSDRLAMAQGEKDIDWGMAETLAYATLVDKGHNIRLCGEDSGRGTFFHRHSVIHNQTDNAQYIPLAHIKEQQGTFEVFDSVLSEEAALAFEYGYASTNPKTLTIWEAQFGDFANGAQIVIDQFISSGEQKWGRMCGLTLFLPHGFEGQGPEHSSARIERYLQLCAQENMQVCIPSTPAQIYHLLRRQQLRKMRRPLIVFTPKSLLRHPLAVSKIEELTQGTFENVLGEIDQLSSDIKRVILCSGKVFYDLLTKRREQKIDNIALIRIEQLYPYPLDEIKEKIKQYQGVKDFIWCQEEPKNQGAWYCSKHNFEDSIPKGATLRFCGRKAAAAPAVGSISVHKEEQETLVANALDLTF